MIVRGVKFIQQKAAQGGTSSPSREARHRFSIGIASIVRASGAKGASRSWHENGKAKADEDSATALPENS
jgi:hypothetical protein